MTSTKTVFCSIFGSYRWTTLDAYLERCIYLSTYKARAVWKGTKLKVDGRWPGEKRPESRREGESEIGKETKKERKRENERERERAVLCSYALPILSSRIFSERWRDFTLVYDALFNVYFKIMSVRFIEL